MDVLLFISRLILAVTFAVAGVAKLYDRAGSRQSLADFGVTPRLVPLMAWLIPIAEILIAIALIPATSAWIAGVVALILLTSFSIGIARKLIRGEAADCHCFGRIESGPIGWRTLARNGVFTTLAAVVVTVGWGGFSISGLAWVADVKAIELAGLTVSFAVLGTAIAVVHYLRRVVRELSSAREQIVAIKKVLDEDYAESQPIEREGLKKPKAGLPIGAPAPSFFLESVDGDFVGLDDLLGHRKPIVFLFVSALCATCKGVLSEVASWQRDYGDELTIVVASKGSREEITERLDAYGIGRLLMQGEPPISDRFRANWTPSVVLISSRGKIASGVVYGESEIRELVRNARTTIDSLITANGGEFGNSKATFAIGESVPEFSSHDIYGNRVTSSDLFDNDTLLMFWSPDCPWCVRMLEDLRQWEAGPPKGAPSLVMIASGKTEQVTPMVNDLRSTVVLDSESEITNLFEASFTPSGIVVDRDGRIASGLAVGVKDVLALAGIEHVKALVDSVV